MKSKTIALFTEEQLAYCYEQHFTAWFFIAYQFQKTVSPSHLSRQNHIKIFVSKPWRHVPQVVYSVSPVRKIKIHNSSKTNKITHKYNKYLLYVNIKVCSQSTPLKSVLWSWLIYGNEGSFCLLVFVFLFLARQTARREWKEQRADGSEV